MPVAVEPSAPETVVEKMRREKARAEELRAQAKARKGKTEVSGMYRIPMKAQGPERMTKCLYCDERKPLKEMWRGQECLACHEKK